jgi:hypothetical protein
MVVSAGPWALAPAVDNRQPHCRAISASAITTSAAIARKHLHSPPTICACLFSPRKRTPIPPNKKAAQLERPQNLRIFSVFLCVLCVKDFDVRSNRTKTRFSLSHSEARGSLFLPLHATPPRTAARSPHTRPRSPPPASASRSAPSPLPFPIPSHIITASVIIGARCTPAAQCTCKPAPPDRPAPPTQNPPRVAATPAASAENRRPSDSTAPGPQTAPPAAGHRTRSACRARASPRLRQLFHVPRVPDPAAQRNSFRDPGDVHGAFRFASGATRYLTDSTSSPKEKGRDLRRALQSPKFS